MVYRSLALAVSASVLGLMGCTHNGGSMSAPSATPTTTLSDSGLTKEQLETQGKDKMAEGQQLQAKGIADNSEEEKTKGQQMQDDGQKMLDEAKTLAPSK